MSTYLIGLFLQSIPEGVSHRSTSTLVLGLTIILSCLFVIVLRANLLIQCELLAVGLRKTLSAFLYRKLLKLPISVIGQASSGKLITLASGDMALIEQGASQLHFVFAGPISCIL